MHPQIKKHLVSSLLGTFLILSCEPVLGQVMLDQGVPLKISKQLTYRGLSEPFGEWFLFDPPVRQVAIFGMMFGGGTFEIGETINVEIFRNSLDYFYGTNGTNMIFHGPTNQIRFVTPLTWTTNTAFAQVTMVVGSALITNIILRTKSVGADGGAFVHSDNISDFSWFVPSPRLTVDNSYTWLFGFSYLLWPTNAVGYRLEESEALPQSPWRPVTNLIGTIDTNHFYEVYVYGSVRPQRYYRLRKPF